MEFLPDWRAPLGLRIRKTNAATTAFRLSGAIADHASCVWAFTSLRLVTRLRSFPTAYVFAVFRDFLLTARLFVCLRFLETFAFVFRTIARFVRMAIEKDRDF